MNSIPLHTFDALEDQCGRGVWNFMIHEISWFFMKIMKFKPIHARNKNDQKIRPKIGQNDQFL